jgi:hypothetical protein
MVIEQGDHEPAEPDGLFGKRGIAVLADLRPPFGVGGIDRAGSLCILAGYGPRTSIESVPSLRREHVDAARGQLAGLRDPLQRLPAVDGDRAQGRCRHAGGDQHPGRQVESPHAGPRSHLTLLLRRLVHRSDADPTDQDQEWIWLILIHADSEAEALRWGDQLAAEYCRGEPWNVLTCSYIDQDPEGDLSSLSETRVGDRAFKIAWADKLATVILPALERARDDVLVASRPRPRTAGAPGAPEPPAAREMPRARFEAAAEIRTSDRPLVIELAISCAGREEHLDFRPYELDVAVYVYAGNDTLTAQKLPVESITDEVVVPLVASFVERSLALLI